MFEVAAEYLAEAWSWLVCAGAWLIDFERGTLAGWISGAGSLAAAWVALYLGANANQAKLETTAKLFHSPYHAEKTETIEIGIKNIGPRKVSVYHLEMCRVKIRGISLYGLKREYEACKEVRSYIEWISPREKFRIYDAPLSPYVEPSDPPSINSKGSSGVLDIGKGSVWVIPRNLDESAHAPLAELASTKKEAKTVKLVVCTDHGKFPIKSEKSVKKFLVSIIISAIKRKANAPPSTGKQ
ncbi:MAG: hypothetical protein MPK09_05625 [Gammaproteobacteria bacterium]|nr:hypothetical protein [Gammaproteobacteria bacterium]